MANSITHQFVSPKSDDVDTSLVRPSNWNAEHNITIDPSTVDHGELGGLYDDDHTQYALLAGRSGGQTLIGGFGTTDNLTLQSTSGVGADFANDIVFLIGNNGSKEMLRLLNSTSSGPLFRIPGGNTANNTSFVIQNRNAADTAWRPLLEISSVGALIFDTENTLQFRVNGNTQLFSDGSNFVCPEIAVKPSLVGSTVGQFIFSGASSFAQILQEQASSLFITIAGSSGDIIFRTQSSSELGRFTSDGNLQLGSRATAAELRFLEPSGSGSNYTAFKAQAQSADITYLLPATDGVPGARLTTDGAGGLTWESVTTPQDDLILADGDATVQIWEQVLATGGITITERANGAAIEIGTTGFSGTVTPVVSITVVNGLVTAVS